MRAPQMRPHDPPAREPFSISQETTQRHVPGVQGLNSENCKCTRRPGTVVGPCVGHTFYLFTWFVGGLLANWLVDTYQNDHPGPTRKP